MVGSNANWTKGEQKSLFLQNEWRNAAWSILAGVRVDKHNLIKDAIVSPRINIRFAPVPLIVLRGGYSTGFRAPQAFDEDLHITAVGGEVSIIQLSPQLRPEFSQSFTLSADLYRSFGSVQTNLVIEVFYTHLKDVFLLEEMGRDDQGNLLMERRNGSGALVRGVNVEGTIAPDKRFQLQLGGTLQKSLYTRPEVWSSNPDIKPQRNMFRTPDLYGYFTATCTPTTAHSLLLRHLYRPHAGTTLRRIYTGRSGVQDTRLFRFHGQACIQLQSDRRCHSSAQRRHTEPLQQFSGGFRPGTASRCGIHVWTVTAENALCRSKIHDVTSGTSQPIPRFIWWDR